MDMSSSATKAASNTCKISMLWNWYTINSCFIARSWHVRSKAQFAGTCIGCFLLVVSAQWLHRFAREYDNAIVRRRQLAAAKSCSNSSENQKDAAGVESTESSLKELGNQFTTQDISQRQALMFLPSDTPASNLLQPIVYVLSHNWFLNFSTTSSDVTKPTLTEHFIRALIFTIQWGQSYIIMLLFMYYNGYVIISCILGAFFGRVIFNYEEISGGRCNIRSEQEGNDRKCCL